MDTWCDEILYEVELVKALGIPGRVIVFGKQSCAILTGNKEEDVLIAAAELGRGRVVVFAHSGYAQQLSDVSGSYDNSILYRNVRNWATQKEFADDKRILKLDSPHSARTANDLEAYDLLVSTGGQESVPCQSVKEFIKKGGGFIHAVTPWGYLQCYPGKKVYETGYSTILLELGISYSKELSRSHGPGYAPELNKAGFMNIHQCLSKDTLKLIDMSGLLTQLNELPTEHSSQFKGAMEKHWKVANDRVCKVTSSGSVKCNCAKEKCLLDFWLIGMEFLGRKNFKAPGIKEFPGDFISAPRLTRKEVKFNSSFEDYFFTSCYAPAGTEVSVAVSKVTRPWTVVVGAHSDFLNKEQVNRWPKVSLETEINRPGTFDVSSPFGGSVYFRSPGQSACVEAVVNNVVISPRFETTVKGRPWKEIRNDPGLWADLSGRHVTITLPSSSIRGIDDPTPALDLYDQLLKAYHELRGTCPDKERKQWIVADVQTSYGYMHAGYPIMTHLDVADPSKSCFLLDTKTFKSSESWGIYHEIGHNMQQNEWTFDGTLEVTVNIFTLYGMDVICGIDPWEHPWLRKQTQGAIDYLKAGANFQKWKASAGPALYVYAQLVHYFKWDAYKRVFRRYQVLNQQQKPRGDQDKIDFWYLTFSEETKCNLASLAFFWGIPLSDCAVKRISALNFKPFLPDDEITRAVPDRVKLVKDRFPGLVQKC